MTILAERGSEDVVAYLTWVLKHSPALRDALKRQEQAWPVGLCHSVAHALADAGEHLTLHTADRASSLGPHSWCECRGYAVMFERVNGEATLLVISADTYRRRQQVL